MKERKNKQKSWKLLELSSGSQLLLIYSIGILLMEIFLTLQYIDWVLWYCQIGIYSVTTTYQGWYDLDLRYMSCIPHSSMAQELAILHCLLLVPSSHMMHKWSACYVPDYGPGTNLYQPERMIEPYGRPQQQTFFRCSSIWLGCQHLNLGDGGRAGFCKNMYFHFLLEKNQQAWPALQNFAINE